MSVSLIHAEGVNLKKVKQLTCQQYYPVCDTCTKNQFLLPFNKFSSDPDALEVEADQSEITEKIDYLILDPPRVGCHPRVLETILKVLPNKILMVSCDPENMMRDLNILSKGGEFKVKNVIPVDMFPQTRHIECLAFLERDV